MIATLIALDRQDDAQTHRWACFEDRLSLPHLRDYLKALPDFEDVEAEDRARQYALRYPDILPALHFCLEWPDLLTGSQMVISRADEIDGDDYEFINYAVDMLRDKYPLAAVLLVRSMINFTVSQGRTSRAGYLAGQLQDCETLDAHIADYAPFAPHADYVDHLRHKYGLTVSALGS
jgi:hypothetical protein